MNSDASGVCTSWPTYFWFKMRKLNLNITRDLLLCNLEFINKTKKKSGNGKEIIIHNEPFVVVVFIISIKLKSKTEN